MATVGDGDFLEVMFPLKRVAHTVGLWGHGSIFKQEALLESLGCPQGLTWWSAPSRAVSIGWVGG